MDQLESEKWGETSYPCGILGSPTKKARKFQAVSWVIGEPPIKCNSTKKTLITNVSRMKLVSSRQKSSKSFQGKLDQFTQQRKG